MPTAVKQSLLQRTTLFLALLVLLAVVLYFAKPFLVPVALAAIFAMLFLPLSRRLEGWGWPRGLAAFACTLLLLVFVVGIVTLLSWQIRNLAEDAAQVGQEARALLQKIQLFAEEKLGVSREQQRELLEKQQSAGGENAPRVAGAVLGSVSAVVVDFVLMLVYILLFLYYRTHFKTFILRLVPDSETANAKRILNEAAHVTQQYLVGMGLMIASVGSPGTELEFAL